MSIYKIPEEFYFRIHHVRPRFKGDIENVLIYMAEEISSLGKLPKEDFVNSLNDAIYRYPGNANFKIKTINNWRTEISALFGFILKKDEYCEPGTRAKELAEKQDLVESFKTFLYNFQYPGGHIKPLSIQEQIENGISFKPCQCILNLLRYANRDAPDKNSVGISKCEVCHCLFNDLRVTRDQEPVERTWARILENRKNNVKYDESGDVVRYAGDIIDYMEIANLLKTYNGQLFYLNTVEEESILKFCNSKEWFSGYDDFLKSRSATLNDIKEISDDWFEYVNRDIKDTDFSTDILTYISSDGRSKEYNDKLITLNFLEKAFDHSKTLLDDPNVTTKRIGDVGESLVYFHECMRVKTGGREDLVHLIQRIPTQYAVGYDISSVELDERKRYIEVKTTISSKPLHFNRVHLTKNEWNTASTVKDRYFIYRLSLSKSEIKLFLLQNPVGLYKQDQINMIPNNGAEILFDPNQVGHFADLLKWTP